MLVRRGEVRRHHILAYKQQSNSRGGEDGREKENEKKRKKKGLAKQQQYLVPFLEGICRASHGGATKLCTHATATQMQAILG